jgi:preprotein translocase SecE subunit
MARDRKRAKQRQQRRQAGQQQRKARSGDRSRDRARKAPETEPDADEPEAQTAGTGAAAAGDEPVAAGRDGDDAERAPDYDPDQDHEFDDAELDADPDELTRHDELAHSSAGVDEVELAMATGATPPGGRGAPVELEKPSKREREREKPRSGDKPSGLGRFPAFLRASWRELKRVQWPDRRQTAQATAVTLGFVVVAGTYLGVLDFVWQELVSLIL